MSENNLSNLEKIHNMLGCSETYAWDYISGVLMDYDLDDVYKFFTLNYSLVAEDDIRFGNFMWERIRNELKIYNAVQKKPTRQGTQQ